MKVLGISPLDKDATISLLDNGRIVFAAGEERFTRVKLQDGFPLQALQAGLAATGIRPNEIDVVTYPFFDWQRETALFTANIQHEQEFLDEMPIGDTDQKINAALAKVPQRTLAIPGLSDPNEKMEKRLLNKIFYRLVGSEGVLSRNVARRESQAWSRDSVTYHKSWQEELERNLQELGLLPKLKRYDHHLAHSAAAYFASPFDRALIITLDGYGSGLAGSVCVGGGG